MDMKRFFLYAIVITALALAGCGGGGGGTSLMVGDERATQALIDALQDDRDDQKDRADTAEGDRDKANTTLMAIMGLLGTPDTMQATLEAAIMELQDDSADLVAVRDELNLPATATRATIVATIGDLMGPELPAPTAKTNAITNAIVAPSTMGDPSTARGVNYTGRPGNETAQDDVVFARAGNTTTHTTAAIFVGNPTAAIADADQLDKVEMMDDPDSDDPMDMVPVATNFMEYGSEGTIGSGFTSQVYKRTNMDGDQTDEINVYTNMEDPKAQAFNVFYTQNNVDNRDGVSAVVTPADGATDTAATNVDERKVHVTLALATTDDFSDLFDARQFRSTGTGSETINYGPATDTDNEYRAMFEGNFNGVPGTYTCDGTCSATLEAGKLTSLTGTWNFTPNDVKSTIPGVDHDSDFLAFGWWLRSVTDEDGETTYSIGTFAEGATLYTVANAQELVGTASYSGPAAGKFARKTLAPNGEVDGLDAGHFDADASLKAYFGGGDVAANKHFTISGTVTNFRDGNNDPIDAGWTVELMKAGFAASGDNGRDTTLADDTFGGATTGKGDWQGRFYGPHGVVTNDADTLADETTMEYPTGVAGEFTGHFSNGHVIGAFGATKD